MLRLQGGGGRRLQQPPAPGSEGHTAPATGVWLGASRWGLTWELVGNADSGRPADPQNQNLHFDNFSRRSLAELRATPSWGRAHLGCALQERCGMCQRPRDVVRPAPGGAVQAQAGRESGLGGGSACVPGPGAQALPRLRRAGFGSSPAHAAPAGLLVWVRTAHQPLPASLPASSWPRSGPSEDGLEKAGVKGPGAAARWPPQLEPRAGGAGAAHPQPRLQRPVR